MSEHPNADLLPRAYAELTSRLNEADERAMAGKPQEVTVPALYLAVLLERISELLASEPLDREGGE